MGNDPSKTPVQTCHINCGENPERSRQIRLSPGPYRDRYEGKPLFNKRFGGEAEDDKENKMNTLSRPPRKEDGHLMKVESMTRIDF